VADKKIAGILVENNIAGNTIKECFAGIGLNINQETFSSDAPNPVSLKILTGNEYDINKCLEVLSEQIVHFYNILKSGESHMLDNPYSRNLYRIFEEAGFESVGKTFKGKIQGTDPYGRLIIMINQGEIKSFDFKEVAFII
jgi:BirA family biotin operon repressor/biotin-[acetyl-CoA-carboxylase] ligase